MSIVLTFLLTLFIMTSLMAGRITVTLYALKLGAQPFTVGILAALFSVLPVLLSWQIGRFSDRFGSRWLLMTGTIGGALGIFSPYLIPGLPALYIAALSNGLLFACSGATLQNLVGLQSLPEDSIKNFSNFSLLLSFCSFLGPLLAGLSMDWWSPSVACLFQAALLLIPMALIILWGSHLPKGHGNREPRGSVRAMLSESGLWRVLATSSLVITGIDIFQIYLPIYGHRIGLSASAIGTVLAAFSLAALIVRFFLPQMTKRLGPERVLAYAFLIGAAGFLLMPFFVHAALLMLVSFLFGLGMGCGQPITLMMTFSSSTKGRSGEAMGLRVTVNHLTRVIVPIVFGSIGSAFGLSPVFWTNALMLASGGLLTRPTGGGKRIEKT